MLCPRYEPSWAPPSYSYLLCLPSADLARWQASTISHLALLQQAFEVPGTRPEEDVQLLFRSAEELAAGGVPGRGPGPLLQVGWWPCCWGWLTGLTGLKCCYLQQVG